MGLPKMPCCPGAGGSGGLGPPPEISPAAWPPGTEPRRWRWAGKWGARDTERPKPLRLPKQYDSRAGSQGGSSELSRGSQRNRAHAHAPTHLCAIMIVTRLPSLHPASLLPPLSSLYFPPCVRRRLDDRQATDSDFISSRIERARP